ncbi:MAG: hypothetical protein H0W76_23130 [Pyrinomonadaceae bacterium]|nr:hypothetical protein [Pyrinomonadaceae bacterium]
MAASPVNQLSLTPLGAGDLIDRTVRLYRRHLGALIRTAAPPVIVSAIGVVLWTIGVKSIAATDSGGRLFAYIALAGGGVVLMVCGYLLHLIVVGGASRNLVTHLLWNEPVSARAIYRSVQSRFWGLLGATLAVAFCVTVAAAVALVVWYIIIIFAVLGVAAGMQISMGHAVAWVLAAFGVVIVAGGSYAALWLFFRLAGRVVYVPQVMMVEGLGVFAAVARSAKLAQGNVRRLMAMFVFTTFATYSALLLLLIPLGWYGHLNGINPLALTDSDWPVWYSIGYQVVAQCSTILLTPVWMLGLSLLYVDERVRLEGYDIELMAARVFGEMPTLTTQGAVPLSPALAAPLVKPRTHSVLGL